MVDVDEADGNGEVRQKCASNFTTRNNIREWSRIDITIHVETGVPMCTLVLYKELDGSICRQ